MQLATVSTLSTPIFGPAHTSMELTNMHSTVITFRRSINHGL